MIIVFLRIFSALWSVRTTKYLLFYLYLWQLKEYHIGRFRDHFRTEKGKKLFFNKLLFVKILIFVFLVFVFFFQSAVKSDLRIVVFIFSLLFFIYLLESLFFLKNILDDKFKRPVLTKKSLFLILIVLALEIFYFFFLATKTKYLLVLIFWLLFFDIFTPFIVSLVVLFFQPAAVLIRNQIIKKATKKREEMKNLNVIGITGSYGKTSTKEFLNIILSSKFKVLKTEKNQNSEIGISRRILKELKPEHHIFIVEMGAYGKGGIKLLSDIVKPKIGIITGINEQHLALFRTMENLISAEGGVELLESLSENGIVILNGDNKTIIANFLKHSQTDFPKGSFPISNKTLNVKKVFCSTKEKMDLWAEDIKVEPEILSFKIVSKNNQSADFRINLAGGFNIINILLATAAAMELGMSLEEIKEAAKKIKIEDGSIKIIKNKKGIIILDSSYSANPDGVIADLDYLKIYPGKKIIVMPCLIELGKKSKEIHQKIGEKIAEVCDLAIITTKDKFDDIKKGAGDFKNLFLIENPKKITVKLNEFCQSGDVVLFEGRVSKTAIADLEI